MFNSASEPCTTRLELGRHYSKCSVHIHINKAYKIYYILYKLMKDVFWE